MIELLLNRKYDHRTLKINGLQHDKERAYITGVVEDFIDNFDYLMRFEDVETLWALNDMYTAGYQLPIGHTENVLGDSVTWLKERRFMDSKLFKTHKDDKDYIWVKDNRVGPAMKAIKSYVAKGRKKISVAADSYPGNDGIEFALRELFEREFSKKQIWDTILNPTFDNQSIYGLGWFDCVFNRRINPPMGDIEWHYYHPRDIIFDIFTKMKYFLDNRCTIRKRIMEVDEARMYFSQKVFGLTDEEIKSITGDSDYTGKNPTESTSTYEMTNLGKSEFVTVYFGEYTQMYSTQQKLVDLMGYNDILNETNQEMSKEEVPIDEKYMFDFVYTKGLGVRYHAEAKYYDRRDIHNWQFSAFPVINYPHRIRTFPESDPEPLIVMQDILNLAKSLKFDNLRQENNVKMILHSALKEYGDGFEDFIRDGGKWYADFQKLGLDKNFKLQDLIYELKTTPVSPEIMDWISLTIQDIKENGVVHESLAGEYPDKGTISGVAVQKLQNANMSRLQYKEDHINWACTNAGLRMYRIYAAEFKYDDFIKLQGRNKNDPKHAVLNGIFPSIQDYTQFVSKVYPKMEIQQALVEFEEHNDVEVQYSEFDKNGLPQDPDEIVEKKSVVYVNQLIDPATNNQYGMDIKVQVSFSDEVNEIQNTIIAKELRANGDLSLKDYYSYLPSPFKDRATELIDNVKEEREVIKLAEELINNPEEMQMLQQMKQAKAQQENEGNKKNIN